MEQLTLRQKTFIPLKPINVLLVEDDADAARLTSHHVSDGSVGPFQVEWSETLQEAMARLANPGIDVILLDLGMPELSGAKTHLAIKSVVGKAIPVVILTSDGNPDTRQMAAMQGASGYLIKSRTSPVEIRRALHQAITQ